MEGRLFPAFLMWSPSQGCESPSDQSWSRALCALDNFLQGGPGSVASLLGPFTFRHGVVGTPMGGSPACHCCPYSKQQPPPVRLSAHIAWNVVSSSHSAHIATHVSHEEGPLVTTCFT